MEREPRRKRQVVSDGVSEEGRRRRGEKRRERCSRDMVCRCLVEGRQDDKVTR